MYLIVSQFELSGETNAAHAVPHNEIPTTANLIKLRYSENPRVLSYHLLLSILYLNRNISKYAYDDTKIKTHQCLWPTKPLRSVVLLAGKYEFCFNYYMML